MALPLVLARAPLFIGMIASVSDDEGHKLAAEMHRDVEWALDIARNPNRWQEGFT